MKILVDTNVIIDFLLIREPCYNAAERIFELIYQGEVEAFTTASSITDIYCIVAKRLGSGKAREVLQDLYMILPIISVDGIDCIWALDLPITDFEDALVITCANKEQIDYIVTNDKEFIKITSQQPCIINSYGFLKKFGCDFREEN